MFTRAAARHVFTLCVRVFTSFVAGLRFFAVGKRLTRWALACDVRRCNEENEPFFFKKSTAQVTLPQIKEAQRVSISAANNIGDLCVSKIVQTASIETSAFGCRYLADAGTWQRHRFYVKDAIVLSGVVGEKFCHA